jgi:hypothetical protein
MEPVRKGVSSNVRMPSAYDVLLRAIPGAVSLIELEDLRALASVYGAGEMQEQLDAAITSRVNEIVRLSSSTDDSP